MLIEFDILSSDWLTGKVSSVCYHIIIYYFIRITFELQNFTQAMPYQFQQYIHTVKFIGLGDVSITNYGSCTTCWDRIWKMISKLFPAKIQVIILHSMNLPAKSNRHPLFLYSLHLEEDEQSSFPIWSTL